MDFLLFLWAEDHFKSQRIDTSQMTVLIFGATDSPSANYALTPVGRPRREFSSGIETILKSFYEDNLLKCVVTKQEAINLRKNKKQMGFDSPNSDHEDVVKCVTDSEINQSVQKKNEFRKCK